MQDRRCGLGLAARIEMVRRREAGESLRHIAAAMACSPSTVKTQCDRWARADERDRADFSCLVARRPVPKSCPHALSAEQERRILDARARTNWGPMRLTALTGRHRSTIWKVLARHGVSGRRPSTRQTFRRFEWSQPGALVHIDAYKGAQVRCSGPSRRAAGLPRAHPRLGSHGRDRRPGRPHAPGLCRAAQRRERHQRLHHPQARRRVDAPARPRPRPGGHERQRLRLHREPEISPPS
jgi:hypothetical protein